MRKLHAAQWTDHAKRGIPEHMHWLGERARQLRELGTDFLATHPTDPRRWDVLVMLQHSGVQRAANPNPGGSLLSSPARETALWQQRYFSMLEDLLEAPDASRPARHGALMQLTAMVPISAGRSNVPEHRRFDAAR